MRFFLLFLISFVSLAASHSPQNRHLAWERKEPLQWIHFQGKPEADDNIHGAVTYAGIDLMVDKIQFPNGTIRFKARAIFDKKRSWVKEENQDLALLAHEQLHFDITEVYGRKLVLKLNELRLSKNDKAQIRKWQNRYWQAQLNAQKLYDKESVHGINAEQQQAWRSLIDAELRRTDSRLNLQPLPYAANH